MIRNVHRIMALGSLVCVLGGCATGRATAIKSDVYVQRHDGVLEVYVRADNEAVRPGMKRIGLYDGSRFVEYARVAEAGRRGDRYALRIPDGTVADLKPGDAECSIASIEIGVGRPDDGYWVSLSAGTPPRPRPDLGIGTPRQRVKYWLPPVVELAVLTGPEMRSSEARLPTADNGLQE